MIVKKLSDSPSATKAFGRTLARKILNSSPAKKAIIVGLSGELGSGKTCFSQGFASGLGIKEKILSPTFVIFRKFEIRDGKFKKFYHFDCYRIGKPGEILALGFREIVSDPENIVAIEWPEKIKKILPRNFLNIKFSFIEKNKREIVFFMPRNTTSSVFFYVYVLESQKDKKLYIGYTNNLRKRIEEHNKGQSFSTKMRTPLKLIYFEGCLNRDDAKRREDYLKTTQGRRFLGLRLIQHKRKAAFGAGR